MSRTRPSQFRIGSTASSTTRVPGWLRRCQGRVNAILRAASASAAYRTFRIEGLEDRTLFTTFPADYAQTLQPGSGTFVYYDGTQNVLISYNDVAFEAVGAAVNATTGGVTAGDLAPGVFAPGVEPTQGTSLYQIYIVASAADSYISIASVTDVNGAIHLSPYGGSIPQFAVTSTLGTTFPNYKATIPAGTGSVLLGALETVNPPNTPSPTPITSISVGAPIGIEPAPASGTIKPGIEELAVNPYTGLANNDFGNFLFGGTVMGTVAFPGNVNEFYAGAVLTGDINGDIEGAVTTTPTSTRPDPGNFSVGGDLREFLTTGPVGTDGVFFTNFQNQVPRYVTSFDLNVGGKLGEMHIGNTEHGTPASFAGTVEVTNSPYISYQDAYPTTAITNIQGQLGDQTEWEDFQPQFPDDIFADGGISLRNNTIADAQLLSSIAVVDPTSGLPVRDSTGQIIYEASVDGTLDPDDGDGTDYYEVPIIAGTSFQVALSEGTVTVTDPDGRVVASNSKSLTTAFQVTADRPGLYRFAVSGSGDYNLTVTNIGQMGIGGIIVTGNMTDDGIDTSIVCSNNDIGAIVVGGIYDSLTTGPTPTATDSNAPITTEPPLYSPDTIFVSGGNLRAVIAGQIGEVGAFNTSTYTNVVNGVTTKLEDDNYLMQAGIYLDVPFGSVGLVRTTTGPMVLNTEFDPNYQNIVSPSGISEPQYVTNDQYATAIGGDIQVIDAATQFEGLLAVDGGIGTIHAGSMATVVPSFFDVNADNAGSDGIIDLIDCTGEFGNLDDGGPGIVTNEGGQVRYMLIGGSIYRDDFFGGGVEEPVIYDAGQVASMTDDAGNMLTITPLGPITTTVTTIINTPSSNTANGVATTSTSTVTSGPQITVTSYAIRDKGGQVPISITSSGSLQITSNATAAGSSQVNVGTVTIQGNGSQIVTTGSDDSFGNPTITQTPPTTTALATTGTTTATTVTNADGSTTTTEVTISGGATTTVLSALFNGSAKINVLDFVSTGPNGVIANPGDGDATLIENETTGEIASITAPNVGQILVHGNLGFATPVATAAGIFPRATLNAFSVTINGITIPIGNVYPFVQQHTGVQLDGNIFDVIKTGNAVDIDAYGAIGNVALTGTLENLVPNYAVSTKASTNPIPGQFSGLVGPIYGNTLVNIDVGQGLLPTGTGLVGMAGIFATGAVGVVDNNGNPNGDIRGNIISSDTAGTNVAIGEIFLKNASIIDSEIINLVGIDFSVTSDLSTIGLVINTSNDTPFRSPYVYGVGSINVSGDGGILGTDVESGDIGPVTVSNGGFGILESEFVSVSTGRIASITASGYGIRDTDVTDGGYIGPITTTGNGGLVSVLNYPIDVRESDAVTIDPYFNFAPTPDTDLNAALGTTAQFPNIANTTDTGVIEDDQFDAQESFAGLTADKVRTAEPIFNPENTLPTPSIPNIPYIGVAFPMSIAVGGSIGYIRVANLIDGLQITAGRLGTLSLSDDVNRIGISVAGKISSMVIHGNYGQPVLDPATGDYVPDSYINAGGPSGIIGNLSIFGSLYGTVSATGEIVRMLVAGGVYGSITALSTSTPLGLGTLHVTGPINNGSLTIDGNANSIIVDGGLGASAGDLTIDGNVNTIRVGANHKTNGSVLALNLDVKGRLGSLNVFGQIAGSVTTGSDLGNLTVIGAGGNSDAITGNITIGGRLGVGNVINGNVASDISVEGSIGSFNITRGSVLNVGIVQSQIDAIRSFNITGGTQYGLFGSLLAPSGLNGNVNISGNVGDGVDPATISVDSANTIKIGGSVLANTSTSTTFGLNLLSVAGNVATGAVIAAHPLKQIKVKGTNQGTITTD